MRVLITGGYGFIGSHIAERFFKEGHEIFIIDNLSTGAKDNVSIRHKFYNFSVADKKCEEVYRIHDPDIVIHLAAQVDVTLSTHDPYLDSESNILGLVNMLDLARRYGVKKFIFASSAAVYGDAANLPVAETAPVQPMSIYGINKSNGEDYCRRWRELYGLNTVILRFANVYGPRQGTKGEAGVISVFMKRMLENREIIIYGDGTQTRDYVYVEDVAEAVYRAANRTDQDDVINISTDTECTLKNLIHVLSQFGRVNEIRHDVKRHGDIDKSRLDNTRAIRQLDWRPKYTLQAGLEKTYRWYESNWARRTIAATTTTAQADARTEGISFGAVRPYFENLIMFALMILLNFSGGYGGIINPTIGLDYNYIYIATMGILYGKKQSLSATALSAALLIYIFLSRGADLVAILYQSQHLAHFAAYLFIGVVTGYVTDSRERIAADQRLALENLKERYQFLESMYLESVQIKDKLYAQIVNSNDTIAKAYNIVRELDSLEVESVFTAANTIVAETMKTDAVAIYAVGKNGDYLRQKTKIGAALNHLPKSLKISDFAYLQRMMEDKRVFTNKSFLPECPNMAAPIVYEGRVIAVVQLYNVPFERMSLYYENLLNITAMLISDALGRAYLYDQGIQDKKYIESTRILVPGEFEKIQLEIDKRRKNHEAGLPAALLRIIADNTDYRAIHQGLANVIRDEDYIGLKQDGQVYVLLQNITPEKVLTVRERIKSAGLNATDVLGEQYAIQ